MSLALSETLKTGFVALRHIYPSRVLAKFLTNSLLLALTLGDTMQLNSLNRYMYTLVVRIKDASFVYIFVAQHSLLIFRIMQMTNQ